MAAVRSHFGRVEPQNGSETTSEVPRSRLVHQPRVASDAPAIRTTTVWSWLLVIVPAADLAVGVYADSGQNHAAGLSRLAGLLMLGVVLWLAWMDRDTLENRGLRTAAIWWNLLTIPVYLLVRAIKANEGDAQRWVVLGASIAGIIVAFVAGVVMYISSGGYYDKTAFESDIASGVQEQAGVEVTVTCPDSPPTGSGESFTCTVSSTNWRVPLVANVTWTDNIGTYKWTVDKAP